MIDVTLNNYATIPAALAGLMALITALLYGFGSPWYRSVLGTAFFGLFVATVPVFGVVVVTRILSQLHHGGAATTGDGLGLVRFVVYCISALVWLAVFVVLTVERRTPDTRLPLARSDRTA